MTGSQFLPRGSKRRKGSESITHSSWLVCIYEVCIYSACARRPSGFDWDVHNTGHVAAHEVMPQDVEEAFQGRHVIIPAAAKAGEKRWK